MKSLVFALVALLPVWAVAQQVTISPSNSFDGFVTEELVKSGSSFVHTGFKSDQAVVTSHDASGNLLWSNVCQMNSAGRSIATTSTGKFVIAGDVGNDALVATFNSDGSISWAKSFATDSTERWNHVATDALGNAYLVGYKRTNSASSREIWMKLDPSGNTLWAKQALRPSDSYSSFAYCYVKGDSLVAIGTTRNNGVANFGNKDISITVISTQTGSVLSHRFFGTVGFETFMDAEANQQGIAILFGIGNSLNGFGSTRAVMRIGWDQLASSVSAVIIQPHFATGYTLDGNGELALDGQDIYVSGGLSGISTQSSYLVKLDQALDVKWSKRVTLGSSSYPSFGTASLAIGGGVTLVDAKNGSSPSTQSVVSTIDGGGIPTGVACALPVEFASEPVSYSMGAGSGTLVFGDLSLQESNIGFFGYAPEITSCLALLPVELVSFIGYRVGQNVELNWTTATELNNSHFNILRSRDGLEWGEIGRVVGVGTSQTPNDYKFEDVDPIPGGNYYRIAQIDFDGSETPSDMVFVSFERELGVYPNPLPRGRELQGLEGQEFEVISITGQVVRSAGLDTNLDGLPAGTYVIRVTETGAIGRVIVND